MQPVMSTPMVLGRPEFWRPCFIGKRAFGGCCWLNKLKRTSLLLDRPKNIIFTGRLCQDARQTRCFGNSALASSPLATKLAKGILEGNRSCLAESITLVESTLPSKRDMGQQILVSVLNEAKNKYQAHGRKSLSFRIGLSGPPGAGKSTFIEALGTNLISAAHKVAVLAIDPSSSTTGGSLLGDKTRMTLLSRDPNAYIRPTPTSGQLGGVARSTNEAIILCEAFGFDVVIVETVGVGQAEHTVVDMVDMFVLLLPPGAGDELQGLKRGIVELCDLVVVNKADGDLTAAARRMKAEYTSALKFVRPRSNLWTPQVLSVSSLHQKGIVELWQLMQEYRTIMINSGLLEERRQEQLKVWMWNYISDTILGKFKIHPAIAQQIAPLEEQVCSGLITPGKAADILLKEFFT